MTGLLFQAGSNGVLRVHDAGTGDVLFTAPLPGGSTGIPAMYEANGRQYLVVNASQPIGGAGALPGSTAKGGAYVAFALPK